MRHRLIQTLLLTILLCTCGSAQSLTPVLIGSGGSSVTAGSIHLSFSLGEPIVGVQTPGIGNMEFLTQGFQQPNTFSVVLPVEWLSFTAIADGKRNRLNWLVAQTGRESHFDVERSSDGTSFDFLTRLNVRNGNTADYQWIDESYPAALLYYRIRQFDVDGAVTLSPLQTIDRSADNNGQLIRFYPNPSAGWLRWIISASGQTGQINWQLFDAAGRLLRQQDLAPGPTAEIDLSMLPAGSYPYRIRTSTGSENGLIILR
ncbi:T9SS type A sorting domain-containing protein [Neolewinella persica]|uniref:T9SS type A sorting domain-containing protein n=1 Tax=Neolewinella persica TaxID=70998 RepID=UPI00039A0F1A|nr:T9SS type A sorting domain-containing protein [Neolewinella persica]